MKWKQRTTALIWLASYESLSIHFCDYNLLKSRLNFFGTSWTVQENISDYLIIEWKTLDIIFWYFYYKYISFQEKDNFNIFPARSGNIVEIWQKTWLPNLRTTKHKLIITEEFFTWDHYLHSTDTNKMNPVAVLYVNKAVISRNGFNVIAP